MTKEELERLLAETDELDRDILERVILGFKDVPAPDGFGMQEPSRATAPRIANALGRVDEVVVLDRLERLEQRGLVRREKNPRQDEPWADTWLWAETGLVTEFWQLRTAVNFA